VENKKAFWILAAIILSNILGFLAIKGPMSISFSLTAVPILLIALTMGWQMGALVGLFGGIVQALQYTTLWYVFYTAILGGVAGYFAKNARFNRKWGSLFFSAGTMFMFLWIIFTNQSLIASEAFVILISLLMFVIIEYTLIKKHIDHNPLLSLTLAGCAGAAAYIPYDILVLSLAQNYPTTQTLIILGKDLMQDYSAAIIAAAIVAYANARK